MRPYVKQNGVWTPYRGIGKLAGAWSADAEYAKLAGDWLPEEPPVGPSTVFVPSGGILNANDSNPTTTFRVVCTLAADSLGQLRVTLSAATSGGVMNAGHVSIGKRTGAQSDTTATPLPLLFGGADNPAVPQGGSVTSDWVDHSGSFSLVAGDEVVVIVDRSTSGGERYRTGNTNVTTYFKQGSVNYSWNLATEPNSMSQSTNNDFLIESIETQPI